jgi:hypothetical protein
MRDCDGDRGQAALLVLVVAAVLFVVLSVAITELGVRMVDRTQAQTAADAAALAAVIGGADAAHSLARRHGATVVALRLGPAGGEVTVVVRVGTATASAAASGAP